MLLKRKRLTGGVEGASSQKYVNTAFGEHLRVLVADAEGAVLVL